MTLFALATSPAVSQTLLAVGVNASLVLPTFVALCFAVLVISRAPRGETSRGN